MPKTRILTQSAATSQAASRVRQVMAGAMVTARTRGDWDRDTDTLLYVTSVTYPVGHPCAVDARAALMRMPGVRRVESAPGYMTVIRER